MPTGFVDGKCPNVWPYSQWACCSFLDGHGVQEPLVEPRRRCALEQALDLCSHRADKPRDLLEKHPLDHWWSVETLRDLWRAVAFNFSLIGVPWRIKSSLWQSIMSSQGSAPLGPNCSSRLPGPVGTILAYWPCNKEHDDKPWDILWDFKVP